MITYITYDDRIGELEIAIQYRHGANWHVTIYSTPLDTCWESTFTACDYQELIAIKKTMYKMQVYKISNDGLCVRADCPNKRTYLSYLCDKHYAERAALEHPLDRERELA